MDTIRFGTDGWRSRMDDDFTDSNVRRVAEGIADYIVATKGKRVFVGYDGRARSRNFAETCATVLATNGIESLISPRPVPTPVSAFAAVRYSLAGAIMITASHNPAIYNGIKFIPYYGGPATNEITAQIEAMIPEEAKEFGDLERLMRSGMVVGLDPIEDYILHLETLLSLKNLKVRVAVDPMHGATSGIIEKILIELGADVRVIRGKIDDQFGGSVPDPVPNNLGGLRNLTLESGSSLGIALDGDGDRLAVVTDEGRFLMANQLLPLVYLHLLDKRSIFGDAARTVATSHLVDSVAAGNGRKVIETPVGFKYIGELLREKKVIIGGEESGGMSLITHIPEKDGIASALMVIEDILLSGSTLGNIMSNITTACGRFESARLDIRLPHIPSLSGLEKLLGSQILGKNVIKTSKLDGLKVILDDGSWLLFRISGTENVIRVYSESSSPEATSGLLRFGEDAVDKLLS
ncbi:MAG: phosphoglucomutase/phosphomannomutase family protein [Candidatus Methanomethylicaceae archaeon]